jgi:glycerophosphoryl diester phosphodiesterase
MPKLISVMRYKWICFLLLTLMACKRKDRFEHVLILGHAGAGLTNSTNPYHDNTLESILYAMQFDEVQGVEIDIQISSDTTAWLMHDMDLSIETNGNGCVTYSSDEYLSNLHYKTLEKEKLVRLKDVPNQFEGKFLVLDLRSNDGCDNLPIPLTVVLKALENVPNQFPNTELIAMIDDQTWLDSLKNRGFSVYLNAYSKTNFYQYNWQQFDGVCINNAAISKEDVSELLGFNKKVVIFDVRAPKPIRQALKKGPSFLLTDDIKATLIEKYK